MKSNLLFLLFLSVHNSLPAQHDEGFIYGKVTTIDNESYTGCLRWNTEEVFWLDHFNSVKTENKYHRYISEEDLLANIQSWFSMEKKEERIAEDEEGIGKKEEVHYKMEKDLVHVWICAFGDLHSIKVTGQETADLVLRDGTIVKVEGGSNDLGTTIKVLDDELGELSLSWNRISAIEFLATPEKLNRKFGEPLFGTVKTSLGEFTGYLQWDQEERLTTDLLDGKTGDGSLSIAFENINTISKQNDSSLVKLKSGREVFLTGSNDVNKDNRGIIINVEKLGRITVPWSNFETATFGKPGKYMQPGYNDYAKPEKIKGEVVTKTGSAYKGVIVYDLDEEYSFELIQGNDNGIDYAVAASNIRKIVPVDNKCRITMKNGKSILIGGTHDVAEYNSGVLIFTKARDQPVYLKWALVKEINLQ